jgi:hypothetical protein
VSDLFLLEDEVALLQGFGDEGLVLFGGVARERVDIVISEEGMYFFFVVLLVYDDLSARVIKALFFCEFVLDVFCDVLLSFVCVVDVLVSIVYLL